MYKNNIPAGLRERNQSVEVSKDGLENSNIVNSNNNFRTLNLKYMHYIHRKRVFNKGN